MLQNLLSFSMYINAASRSGMFDFGDFGIVLGGGCLGV